MRKMHHSHQTLDQLQTFQMEALKQFPEEYSKSFEASYGFINKANVRYLQDEAPFIKKYWRFFYIVPCLVGHLISMTAHLTLSKLKGDMMAVAYLLPPFLVAVGASLKAVIIIPKTTEISAIIKELGTIWRTDKVNKEQRLEKDKLLKRLNICNKVNFWTSAVGTFQYLISPLLETLFRRYILQQKCELLLPIGATYPWDPTSNWLIYIIMYVFQFHATLVVVSLYIGLEMLMVTLCALLSTQFLMLKQDLTDSDPTLRKNKNECRIDEFIKRHQILIKLSRQLDNVFNRMIFIDLLFVGITTCAFSFAGSFARGSSYTANNYLAVVTSQLNILYLCYYGELLSGASARLGDVAYENLWYKGSLGYKKATWLIINMCQKPCCLTSLRYTKVSLNLFTKVISTTWSYFSLMNSVYTDEEEYKKEI